MRRNETFMSGISPFVVLLPVAALATLGCTPPVDSGMGAPGMTASASVTQAPANVTTPPRDTMTAAASAEEAPVAEPEKSQENEDTRPVLYDSGYEQDNSSCMVCHIDFENETISSAHLSAGITCMACHGDSEDHRADEYNIIRPDVIWGRAEIETFCKQCHEKHEQPEKVEAFYEQWDSKRRPNGRWVLQNSVCTDCHGNHAVVKAEGEFK